MNATYIVYKHTTPDGKCYIGITKQAPAVRWGNGSNYKHNAVFYRAIRIFGWHNIKHEVIASGLTKEAAAEMECALIRRYQSDIRSHGYNIAPGGFAPKQSEATKQKLSALHKGMRASDSTKAKMSAVRKGVPKADAHRLAISKARGGGLVLCVETGETFLSRNAASKATHIGKTQISNCLNGVSETAGGYHWRRVENAV